MTNGFAFGGAMATGKTTAARHLVEKHGFVQIGFATPLYDLGEIHLIPYEYWREDIYAWAFRSGAAEILGWRLEEFVDKAVSAMTQTRVIEGKNRTLLQLLGTEVGRSVDPDLWTKLFEMAAGDIISSGGQVVNDNLRFENELASAQRLDLVTVFFHVPEDVQDARYLAEYGAARTPEQKTHASESELAAVRAGCDLVFVNEGTLDNLRDYMDFLVANATVEV